MQLKRMGNYWNQTETFEALQLYIDLNFEGLKDDVLSMIAGESVAVNTGSFTNDMTTFRTEEYQGNILLVGINYSKKTKKHQCVIEEYQKS